MIKSNHVILTLSDEESMALSWISVRHNNELVSQNREMNRVIASASPAEHVECAVR